MLNSNYAYLTVYPKDENGNIDYLDRRLLRVPKKIMDKLHEMVDQQREAK